MYICLDMDFCQPGLNICDRQSNCENEKGYYICTNKSALTNMDPVTMVVSE